MKRLLPALLSLALVLVATPASAHDRPDRIRVATFNIHAGIGNDETFDLERTAKAIASVDASVIALQEVDVHWNQRSQWRDLAAELADQLDMSVFFAPIYNLDPEQPGEPRRQFGNALLSRFPIQHAENHEITRLSSQVPNPKPELMPGFGEIEIDVDGTSVHLYSTHLDYRADPGIRRAQVADMRRIMHHHHHRFEPRVLLGDFNAPPRAPELRPLWSRLFDAWPAAGDGDGDGFTYPAQNPDSRIDYIAASRGTEITNAAVADTLASDHRPVVAELELPPVT